MSILVKFLFEYIYIFRKLKNDFENIINLRIKKRYSQ